MGQTTKEKILSNAIERFNRDGMANVPMQQIAEDLGMSPGNLAYHFRTKEDLINAILAEVFKVVDELQKTFRIYPNFLDFDLQLNKYLELIQKFPFYFSDIIEINRHYPKLMEMRKEHITKVIAQIEARLAYSAKRGVVHQETYPGQFHNLAESIWMLITFYPTRNNLLFPLKKKVNRPNFMKKVWYTLEPYFTPKGKEEFQTLIAPLLNGNNVEY